ncbi:gliding motility-associated C-terminal domain-containing protein [Carboxylicivirga caseinilyticus]|uniref:T9SS type B sorting domain-containing protein n=1 Tax=Carboxylicivirga caseinilyticus TaxID=3417572 RepID=UPI003D33738B|nr:gliding motility-associated C-terminal domain-containing protein [Marinilabiliaceae bacterium A049]
MNNTHRFFIILVFLLPQLMIGQSITSNAFYSENTDYPGGNNDPIFFYSTMSDAQLLAPIVAGATYNWYSFNTATGAFDILEQSGGETLMNVTEKGYKVDVIGGGTVTPYFCWNFVPAAAIDSIGLPTESCSNIRLTGYVNNKPLVYYNHKGDGNSQLIDYGYSWSSAPTGPIDGVTEVTQLITAPTEDTEYSFVVGQKFAVGITPATLSYAYEAIAVSAVFSFETEGTADNEATEGSAPMVVRYSDESLGNVTDWEWTFGDAGKDYVADPIFTFQKAGDYAVSLWVMNSDSGCESDSEVQTFTVKEIVLKVPTAFTPFSSPGENDEFKVLYRSIKKYRIVIYNRWGRKVFSSSDPAQGWNGRIGNRKAEPGVYFYEIEAEGYNEGEKVTREGAVHLIVTQN